MLLTETKAALQISSVSEVTNETTKGKVSSLVRHSV